MKMRGHHHPLPQQASSMRWIRHSAIRFAALIAVACPVWAGSTLAQTSGALTGPQVSFDPLRRHLPRSDLYMQVPGGQWAVADVSKVEGSMEKKAEQRNGGLVVGYCLKSSCTRVTHLVVLQICNSRIDGLKGRRKLVLGVVKLPYGDSPGQLMSLQGRNYAKNFVALGPFRQTLISSGGAESVSSVYTVLSEGAGPVEPLEFLGLLLKEPQDPRTRSLQLTIVNDHRSGIRFPRLEVRHLCKWKMS